MKKHVIVRVLEWIGLVPLCFLFLSGCALLPELRVFQKKLPPPVEQSKVTEGQRQAADYIAKKIEKPEELKPVAQELATSLGTPVEPVVDTGDIKADSEKIVETLRAENADLRKRIEKQAAWLREYQGAKLEGTGFNLTGPLGFLGFFGIIALVVFVPGTLTAAFFVIRRLRSTVQVVSQSIEEFKVDNPAAAEDLKENYLYPNTDRAHRKVIDREKKYIDRDYIKERTEEKLFAAATPAPTSV